MSYRIYSFGNKAKKTGMQEFEEAAMMVEEGLECMRDIAEDMKDEFGERRGGYGRRDYGMRGNYGSRYGERDYGERGGYGERDMWDDEDMAMRERRRRDSMGRYR